MGVRGFIVTLVTLWGGYIFDESLLESQRLGYNTNWIVWDIYNNCVIVQ